MARRLIWPRPTLYYPFGVLRHVGNVFSSEYDMYISGFPRSGNTFAVKAFQQSNPGVALQSHRHNPAFVVQSVNTHKPGMVLMRNPVDSVISWSIFTRQPLRHTLAYYVDFHLVVRRHRDALFFVSFDSVIEDFGKVMKDFNDHWGTSYVPFDHTPENVARCMAAMEPEFLDASGRILEHKIPRPSEQRRALREMYLKQLNRSPRLQEELLRANELYHLLTPKKFSVRKPLHSTNTTQGIRLRPAM